MFNREDRVEILDGYKDPGDDEFVWIVQGDEEKGRLDIVLVNIGMVLKPVYVVKVDWIRHAEPPVGSHS